LAAAVQGQGPRSSDTGSHPDSPGSQDSDRELPVLPGIDHGGKDHGTTPTPCRTIPTRDASHDGPPGALYQPANSYHPGDLLHKGAYLGGQTPHAGQVDESIGFGFAVHRGPVAASQRGFMDSRSSDKAPVDQYVDNMTSPQMASWSSSSNSSYGDAGELGHPGAYTTGGATGSSDRSTAHSYNANGSGGDVPQGRFVSHEADQGHAPPPPTMSYRQQLRALGEQSLRDYRVEQAHHPPQVRMRPPRSVLGEAPPPMPPQTDAPPGAWAVRSAPPRSPVFDAPSQMNKATPWKWTPGSSTQKPAWRAPASEDVGRPKPPSWDAPGHKVEALEAPNLGSASHHLQKCKPCAFFNMKGCRDGVECQFCHLCEAGEKKRRKKERLAVKRVSPEWAGNNNCREELEEDDEYWPESAMVST